MRSSVAISVLAIFLGSHIPEVDAQNLVNGSFEVGVDPNTGLGLNLGLSAPDSTTIPGWTVSDGTVDYIGGRWVAGQGGRSIDMSGVSAGTIFQTITGFTPGLAYEVNFLMAANPEVGPSTKSLQVDIGGAPQLFSFTGSGSVVNLGWVRRGFDFTAPSATLTLRFTSLENSAAGAALDDVRIAAIPEPSALELCAAGSGLFVLMRAWRRCRDFVGLGRKSG